jgi:hypothetical protein
MKIETPKSFEDFEKIFSELKNSGINYYRGQSDYSWEITPGLARNKGIKNIQNLIAIESKLIQQFKNKIVVNKLEALIPKTQNYDMSWVLLMAAQHYGLPTRFLDFSNNKFAALEFAVSDIENLKKDGAFIIYKNSDKVQEDLSIFEKPFETHYSNSFFVQVPAFKVSIENELNHSETRKTIQGSKFLYRQTDNIYQCLSKDSVHSNNLSIIHIPKNIKIDIIKWLIDKGEMAYDLYAGKNVIDFYAAILKIKFNSINESNMVEYISKDDLWWS